MPVAPAEPNKKCEYLRARITPAQFDRVHSHCERLGVSLGARVLELFLRDIHSHGHFDLTFEVGPTRKPRRAA